MRYADCILIMVRPSRTSPRNNAIHTSRLRALSLFFGRSLAGIISWGGISSLARQCACSPQGIGRKDVQRKHDLVDWSYDKMRKVELLLRIILSFQVKMVVTVTNVFNRTVQKIAISLWRSIFFKRTQYIRSFQKDSC